MKLPESFTKITPFSKVLAFILFITLPILGFILGMQYQLFLSRYPLDNQRTGLSKTAISNQATINPLKAKHIDDVVRGIVNNYVPNSKVNIDSGSAGYDVKTLTKPLNTNEYSKLKEYLDSTALPISNLISLNNSDWNTFSYSDASDLYTKDGYLCILVHPNIFDVPLSFSCAFVRDLKKNDNKEVVLTFLFKSLKEGGILCDVNKCPVTEEITFLPLNLYARQSEYFDRDLVNPAQSDIDKVNKEMNDSLNLFTLQGWKAQIEDYTETEKVLNKETFVSKRVIADNTYFICIQKITIAKSFGKRQTVECNYRIEALTEHQAEINEILGY